MSPRQACRWPSERIAGIFVSLAAASLSAIMALACSSGFGPALTLGSPYETHPGDCQSPGSGRDAPPISNPSPAGAAGPAAGGATVGADGCPPCDAVYTCPSSSQAATTDVVLHTKNGVCVGPDDVVLTCKGTLTDNGITLGTWAASSTLLTVVTAQATYTCTKSTAKGDGGAASVSDGG